MLIFDTGIGSPHPESGQGQWYCYVMIGENADDGEYCLPASSEDEAYKLLGKLCIAILRSKSPDDLKGFDEFLGIEELKKRFHDAKWNWKPS